jgi:hypothetical protein
MIILLGILLFVVLSVLFWFFLDWQLWKADKRFAITTKIFLVTSAIFAIFIAVIVYLLVR